MLVLWPSESCASFSDYVWKRWNVACCNIQSFQCFNHSLLLGLILHLCPSIVFVISINTAPNLDSSFFSSFRKKIDYNASHASSASITYMSIVFSYEHSCLYCYCWDCYFIYVHPLYFWLSICSRLDSSIFLLC